MGELDPDEGALCVAEIDDAFEGWDLRVLPDAGVFGGDLAVEVSVILRGM